MLLDVVGAGPIDVVLGVFDKERMPAESPVCALPSAVLPPHVARFIPETRAGQMGRMVDELAGELAGKQLQFEIPRERVERMA